MNTKYDAKYEFMVYVDMMGIEKPLCVIGDEVCHGNTLIIKNNSVIVAEFTTPRLIGWFVGNKHA